MTDQQLSKLYQIFFPYASMKRQAALNVNQRFVHYTTAETAMSIIQNNEIWMRNATCMNDYLEVEYGLKCLYCAYHSDAGKDFKQTLNGLFSGICEEIEAVFDGGTGHFRFDTFLTCISEHQSIEDSIGRLSMWRAYGKETGVALVLNNKPFLMPSDALKAYTNPVAYLTVDQAPAALELITRNILDGYDFLKMQEREVIKNYVFDVFRFAALSIKHPGFAEEKEWRIAFSPTLVASKHLVKDIRIVNGTPQQIYRIPLKNIPEENFLGAEIPELLDHIIIGPTAYPLALYKAFVDILAGAGVADPERKVVISDIPLRR